MSRNLFPAFQGGTPEMPPIQTHLDSTGYRPEYPIAPERWVLGTTTPEQFVRLARLAVGYESGANLLHTAAQLHYDGLCERAMGAEGRLDNERASQAWIRLGAAVKDQTQEVPDSLLYEAFGLIRSDVATQDLEEAAADLKKQQKTFEVASQGLAQVRHAQHEQSQLSKVPRRILLSTGVTGMVAAFTGTATFLRAHTANVQANTTTSSTEASEVILTRGEEQGVGWAAAGLGVVFLSAVGFSQLKKYAHSKARKMLRNLRVR